MALTLYTCRPIESRTQLFNWVIIATHEDGFEDGVKIKYIGLRPLETVIEDRSLIVQIFAQFDAGGHLGIRLYVTEMVSVQTGDRY